MPQGQAFGQGRGQTGCDNLVLRRRYIVRAAHQLQGLRRLVPKGKTGLGISIARLADAADIGQVAR